MIPYNQGMSTTHTAIAARNLAALTAAARKAGWTVTDTHSQTIDFAKGDRLFVAFHNGGRFDNGYRVASANARDFTGSYSTLRSFVAALNAA